VWRRGGEVRKKTEKRPVAELLFSEVRILSSCLSRTARGKRERRKVCLASGKGKRREKQQRKGKRVFVDFKKIPTSRLVSQGDPRNSAGAAKSKTKP